MSTVKTIGRIFVTEQITHAIIGRNQLTVFPVGYYQVILTGDEMKRMIAALQGAGFLGTETLINPARICMVEEQGDIARVYLEGADRLLYLPIATVKDLFPAPESPAAETAPAKKSAKKGA